MLDELSFTRGGHWLLLKRLALCVACVLAFADTHAQRYSWEEFLERTTEDIYEESGSDNPLLEDLTEIHEHPFNLNTVKKSELERLPFLSAQDIEALLSYIYSHGPMQSVGELLLIDKLDYQTRQYLSLFVYVGQPADEKERVRWKDLWKEGKHEVITRLDVPLYERDGYKTQPDEVLLKNPNKVYLGNALYHNIRYSYKFRNKLYWGFTTEKDEGEPFGSYGNKLYDSYSFHFLLKDWGVVKVLALGDYRIGFGEGLVVNNNFSIGKSTSFNLGDPKLSIKKFSSVSESSFFRGMAITLRLGKVDVSAFYSYLPVDATLRTDGSISSLKTDGLHRTLLEVSKKHNVKEQTAGADVTWNTGHISLGATAMYQHYDRPFSKGTQLYRQYYPDGKDFLNASVHYGWRQYKFSFQGETAFSDAYQGWATLNKAIYRFNNRYSIMALQRFFAYQYVGLEAGSFSEGGAVRNESGFYLGAEAAPLSEWKFSAYVDYFYFPWVKYATPHTSEGVEMSLQSDYAVSEHWELSGRYQLKRKERYGNPYLYHKLRMQVRYMPVKTLEWRAMGRYTLVRDEYGGHVHGYMAGSILKWKEKKGRFDLSLSFVYFNSEDYKAAMSFYEPSLPYAYSFMTMYGRGTRTAVYAKWKISSFLTAMVKFGATGYTDRDEIGEDLQRIDGRWKNDLSFQLSCKL